MLDTIDITVSTPDLAVLRLFKAMVARATGLNTDNIRKGFVTNFDPTPQQLKILAEEYKPLPLTTLFTVHERQHATACELIRKQILHYFEVYGLDTPGLFRLLNTYPTATPARRRAYLNCDRPNVSGPHELWPTDDEQLVASIWSAPNEFQSWPWEGRSPNRLPVEQNLVAWSCPNTTYGEIRRHAEDATTPEDITWFEWLFIKYVDGGVSSLIQSLRDAQEAA